ncbi:MAG TPA: hypothetical protein VGE37_02505, partial [Archangium sp.]
MTSLLVLSLLAAAPAESTSVYTLSNQAFVETAQHDLKLMQQLVSGMQGVMKNVAKNKTLFGQSTKAVYSPEQKQMLLTTWGTLFAYFSATETL